LPAASMMRSEPPSNTILIIDDEEAARYITRQLFRGSRYKIVEARGGAEGAERARFEHPALIVLDLMMPQRNGFNVLDELKSDEATRRIPVVIQTSKSLTELDYERLGSRQVAILPKAAGGRFAALTKIRQILGEANLFGEEPEFTTSSQKVS
jgi:CheY-like chemotaxis protein